MPATKPALSFDEMIKNDRKRRAAEQKAQEIFGRKKTNGTSTEKRTSLPGGSLASRVGVNKRSVSSSASRNPDLTRARPPSTLSRSTTAARLETALHKTDVFNNRKPNASRSTRTELNIRGAAGPYTIVAQNFAPGTTAADIESVMQPVGGTMISSRLVASKPTVIAELVFVDKAGADAVIETFNNQKADGRLLYVFLKSGSAPAPEEILAPVPAPLVEETAYYNQNQDDQMVDDSQPIQQAGRLSPPPAETQDNGNVQQGSQNGGYQNGYDRRQGGHGGYGGRGLWQDRRQEQGRYYGQDRRDGWGYGSRRGGWGGPRNGGW